MPDLPETPKRLHDRIGPRFDVHAERVANMMMDNPIRTSSELGLDLGRVMVQDSRTASITLKGVYQDQVVHGYVKKIDRTQGDDVDVNHGVLTPARAAAELLASMAGTDLGAPTVPYIYIEDRDMLFCPEPFSGATAQNIGPDEGKPGARLRYVDAKTLGAIEPFIKWLRKKDDFKQNRVQAGRRLAIIDNAMMGHDEPMGTGGRQVELGRLRSRFLRSFGYQSGKKTMEERILAYPEDRLEQHAAKIRKAFDPSFAQRTLLQRKAIFGAPKAGS